MLHFSSQKTPAGVVIGDKEITVSTRSGILTFESVQLMIF